MITRISQTITDNTYIGVQHPPADKVIGGEFPYLNGQSAGQYRVPAGYKAELKTMSLSVRTGKVGEVSYNAELAGYIDCGVVGAYIGSSQMTEYRIQEYMLPNICGADEMVTPFYNAFQSPGIGEGVICPAGTTFYIKATPGQNSNIVWEYTVFGKDANGVNIQQGISLTCATTAGQILLQYTPSVDWTILAIYIDAEAIGQVSGQARIDFQGRQVIGTPYIGLGQTSPNAFDPKGFSGYGQGALNIPLWGIKLYEGEEINFIPIPYVADQSVWGLTIFGEESSLSGSSAGFPVVGNTGLVRTIQ